MDDTVGVGGSVPSQSIGSVSNDEIVVKKVHIGTRDSVVQSTTENETVVAQPHEPLIPPGPSLKEFYQTVAKALLEFKEQAYEARATETANRGAIGDLFTTLSRMSSQDQRYQQMLKQAQQRSQFSKLNEQSSNYEEEVLRNQKDPTKRAASTERKATSTIQKSTNTDATVGNVGSKGSIEQLQTEYSDAQLNEGEMIGNIVNEGVKRSGGEGSLDSAKNLFNAFISYASVEGAKRGLGRLGSSAQGMPANGEAIKMATASGFLEVILEEISTGRLEEIMKLALGNDDYAQNFIMGYTMSALLGAATMVAAGLGTPGLVAQLIKNAITDPKLKRMLEGASQTPKSALNSSFGKMKAIESLIKILNESEGIEPGQAESIAVHIWDKIIEQINKQSETNIKKAIMEAFAEARLQQSAARKAALEVGAQIDAEINAPYLDAIYKRELINAEAILDEVAKSGAIATIIQNILLNDKVTYLRDLNEEIEKGLRGAGLSAIEASATARSTVAMVNEQISASTSILQQYNGKEASVEELSSAIRDHVTNSLQSRIGKRLAEEISNLFVRDLTKKPSEIDEDSRKNPISLLSQMEDLIDSMRKSSDEKVDRKLVEKFDEHMKPNVDFYAYIKEATDPGKTLVNALVSGTENTQGAINFAGPRDQPSVSGIEMKG